MESRQKRRVRDEIKEKGRQQMKEKVRNCGDKGELKMKSQERRRAIKLWERRAMKEIKEKKRVRNKIMRKKESK